MPVKRDVVTLTPHTKNEAPSSKQRPQRDIVSLSNLPALSPNDPRQRMLAQHRFPPEMLDMEYEDDDQVRARLDAIDPSLPSVLSDVISHDVDFAAMRPRAAPAPKRAFPAAAHRSQKPNYGVGDAAADSGTGLAHLRRDLQDEESARCAYQGPGHVEQDQGQVNLDASLEGAVGVRERVDALMMGMRSQVTSQRVMAVKLLTQMVTQERLQGTRNGALEYMIAGDQQVPYVTCLRVTLDDRNHNVVTAALQLLHAVVAADAELALLVHLQPLGSFEGGPFEGLLALDSCTDIEMASDGGAMQGREPSSPEELKASINANVCIALLSMNLLPRLRYCMEEYPAEPFHRELILDILIAFCVRTPLTARAIVACPHMVPALQAGLAAPGKVQERPADASHLRIFTKSVTALTLVGLGSRALCEAAVDGPSLFSTMQVLAYACHAPERLHSDLKLLALVHRVLRLWAVCAAHGLPPAQPLVADAFPLLATLLRTQMQVLHPVAAAEDARAEQPGAAGPCGPSEPLAPGDAVPRAEVAVDIALGVLLTLRHYTQSFARAAHRNGEDLRRFVETDAVAVVRLCVEQHAACAAAPPAGGEGAALRRVRVRSCAALCAAALFAVTALLRATDFSEGGREPWHDVVQLLCAVRAELHGPSATDETAAATTAQPPAAQPEPVSAAVTPDGAARSSLLRTALADPLPFLSACDRSSAGCPPPLALDCPGNLLWTGAWDPGIADHTASSALVLAYLQLHYVAWTLHSAAPAAVASRPLLRVTEAVLRQFTALGQGCFAQDPLDHTPPTQFVAAHRLRLFVARSEVDAVYTCLLLHLRLSRWYAVPSEPQRTLVRPVAANLSLLLTPGCRRMYPFLLQLLFDRERSVLLPFFRHFGARAPVGPEPPAADPSCYYTYHPELATGAGAGAALRDAEAGPGAAGPGKAFQLDHFWPYQPILGPHLSRADAEPDAEVVLHMHRPLFVEWLEFMTELEALGTAYLSRYSPLVKLVCLTNVASAAPELLPDRDLHARVGRLAAMYATQLLRPPAPAPSTEKIARLKPHVQRLLDAYAGAPAERAGAELAALFLHSAVPEAFHELVWEQVSASKTVFLQLGAAALRSAEAGLLHGVPGLLPGFFDPPVRRMRRVDQFAELLVVLPNQIQGTAAQLRAKLHGNLLYWLLLHHTAAWVWGAGPRPGDGAGPGLGAVQRRMLCGILRDSDRAQVIRDIVAYRPPTAGVQSVADLPALVERMPDGREAALQACLQDEPEVRAKVLPVVSDWCNGA